MRYFKEIDIDFYDEIVKKSIEYVLSQPFVTEEKIDNFFKLDLKSYFNYCPEALKAFSKLGLTPMMVAVYYTVKDEESPIHIDYPTPDCRINIPLINCDSSATVFYEAPLTTKEQQNNGLNFYLCDADAAVEVARVTIRKATVIRVNKPHKVHMFKKGAPRMCLTVRFVQDPKFLLEDDDEIL